jgi:hypothetical protein
MNYQCTFFTKREMLSPLDSKSKAAEYVANKLHSVYHSISLDEIKATLAKHIDSCEPDELMLVGIYHDEEKEPRSYIIQLYGKNISEKHKGEIKEPNGLVFKFYGPIEWSTWSLEAEN